MNQRAQSPRPFNLRLLLVWSLATTPLCHAQAVTLVTHNGSKDKTAWVTVYDAKSTRILEAGCIAPGGKRDWSGSKYKSGSQYRIRGELTARPNCQAPITCDTSIQAAPVSITAPGATKAAQEKRNTEYRLEANAQTCFWGAVDGK